MSSTGEIQKNGFFWLPSQPDERLPGLLIIEASGHIRLELIGVFSEKNGEETDESQINGDVQEYGYVTLQQCFYTYKPFAYGPVQKSFIIVNQAIIGASFEKNDNLDFHGFSFDVDNLAEWVGISGLSSKNLDAPNTHKIEFILPTNIQYTLSNGMILTISFGYNIPSRTTTTASIEQTTTLKLTSSDSRPLSDFKFFAFQLTNFLSFAMDKTTTMRNFVVENLELQRDYGNDIKRPVQLKLVYPTSHFTESPAKIHCQQMLFSLGPIKDKAEVFINKWLDLYETSEPALNLYFSTAREPNVFSESKFLSLAQSMETLHRRTSTETLMGAEDYEKFKDALLASAPMDSKEWLEARLRFGNEPSFKKRLLSLMFPFRQIIGGSKTVKRLAHKIVTSRNYYTHYDKSLENEAQKGISLLNLTYTMEAICKLLYMKQIGFTIDEIEGRLSYAFKQSLYAEQRKLD